MKRSRSWRARAPSPGIAGYELKEIAVPSVAGEKGTSREVSHGVYHTAASSYFRSLAVFWKPF